MISRKKLKEFSLEHPDADQPLANWYHLMSRLVFASFADLRKTFSTADKVGKFTVFNISGNRYRLIAAVHYSRRRVYIRHVLTHEDYDKGLWRHGH